MPEMLRGRSNQQHEEWLQPAQGVCDGSCSGLGVRDFFKAEAKATQTKEQGGMSGSAGKALRGQGSCAWRDLKNFHVSAEWGRGRG